MKIISSAAAMLGLISLCLMGCESLVGSHETAPTQGHTEHGPGEQGHAEHGHHKHKVLVTTPLKQEIISTRQYVCQIHSCQHIEVRALERGYLQEICVQEGQAVKKGASMFKLLPTLYQAKLASEEADVQRIQIELENAQALAKKGYVSPQEIALKKAELAKAKANLQLARAELGFANVTAPFNGIVDRQRCQLGSLIEEGDILTTFSDNSRMWVYFNVPEARYFEYKADLDRDAVAVARPDDDADIGDDEEDDADDEEEGPENQSRTNQNQVEGHRQQGEHLDIELKLANGKIFPHKGKIGAIEADFNNTTGNIAFRADFPNPDGLLRNGQTGTILIHTKLKDAIVIPQRATFEILARQYVFVVDKQNVVHQRDIKVQTEQEDIFVIESGLEEGDRIILEGIRQVRDGDEIEYEFLAPEEAFKNLKHHAE